MKKLLLSTLLAATTLSAAARDGFAIVIDAKSLGEARSEVQAYADAIEKAHGLKVYTIIDRWGVPDSIRAELQRLNSLKKEPIVGTVLIGDIPVPMIRDGQHMTSAFKMIQSQPRKDSSIPSDRFYDDFHLKFQYLDRDSDANYFYYSVRPDGAQRLHPNIYSGRIRPTDAFGTNRYDKLRAYLRKAVAAKQQQRHIRKMFFFSGHGYISDSKVARMDEKVAWQEHFPSLRDGRRNRISYMDHSDHNPVKEHVMGEVMRTDLDLAVLHHHGAWDTEYFNAIDLPYTVKEAKAYIRKNVRQHVVAAKERGRDWEKMRDDLRQRFDLPASWMDDIFDEQLNRQDSIDDASINLQLEDFAHYGYRPNAPVVIIDACYCGSFHRDNCIANEYIFQPGGTVAVVANTVNVLQDKWSDRLIGLINAGGCVGDIARFSTYLESHVIGDPTYRFAADDKQLDIDHLIHENRPATWRKLLRSQRPDLQCLAIEQLATAGNITSSELRHIYETAESGLVRLMAMNRISEMRDDNAIAVIAQGTQDAFELAQRQAVRLIHESGDDRLIPALIALSIENNTSDRVNFDASTALGVMPKDKLMDEFSRQWDRPEVQTVHKDSTRAIIARAIEHSADFRSQNIIAMDTMTSEKEIRFAIRSQRNDMVHAYVPFFLEYIDRPTTTVEQQVMVLEALGWHKQSYQTPLICERALAISADEKYAPQVRAEALKTYNRLHAQ